MARRVPELVIYDSVDEYFDHYEREYCQGEVYTADEIRVHFTKKTFDHAFSEFRTWEASSWRG